METNAARGDSGGPGRIFRLAKEADAGRLRDIYRPYVTDTAVTFEYDVPSVAEFASRIRHISAQYPYLVCEEGGEIAEYAYLSPFRERAAYDWDVETSVYIEERFQNRGIGSGFYARLLAFAEELGYYNAYGVVTLPNAGSLALHRAFGFEDAGIWHRCGYKLGRWHDVICLERHLGNFDREPVPPISIAALSAERLQEILGKGEI